MIFNSSKWEKFWLCSLFFCSKKLQWLSEKQWQKKCLPHSRKLNQLIDDYEEEHNSALGMADDIDTILLWKSNLDDSQHKYHLKIYWVSWSKAIIIIRKISDQASTIVVQTSKELVQFICQVYQLTPEKIMWVEHSTPSDLNNRDTYFQVIFLDTKAVKYELEQKKLERLIGKTL